MRKVWIYFNKEFIVFVLCGGFSAIFNLLSRIWLNLYMTYPAAIAVSYMIGMLIAFTLNKILVFRQGNSGKRHAVSEFCRFALVNCISLVQTMLVALLFREIIFPFAGIHFYASEVAHFIGLASTTFTSFIGHKFFTFQTKE